MEFKVGQKWLFASKKPDNVALRGSPPRPVAVIKDGRGREGFVLWTESMEALYGATGEVISIDKPMEGMECPKLKFPNGTEVFCHPDWLSKLPPTKCECDIYILFARGCQCGMFQIEMERKNAGDTSH